MLQLILWICIFISLIFAMITLRIETERDRGRAKEKIYQVKFETSLITGLLILVAFILFLIVCSPPWL